MAAAALEQSMLESKDKDTLLEMAKALGVKVNARLKKSDIIDKILDTTGSSSSTSSPEPSGNGAATAPEVSAAPPAESSSASPAESRPESRGESPASSTPQSADAPAVADAPEVVLGPDGEPLADWEIELARSGDAADSATGPASDAGADREPARRQAGHRDVPARNGRGDRNERNGRADATRSGETRSGDTRTDAPTGDRSEGGRADRNRTDDQNGNRSRNDQGGNRPRTDQNEPGEANRRRRRRRKGRGGQEGPQGEDVELVEQDHGFESNEPVDVEGYLDIRDEGYGFLRINGYLPSKSDAYIPLKLARQYGLRKGDHITGKVRPAGRNEKNPGLLEVYTINGGDPELAKKRPHFESLTALFPDQRLTLEDPNDPTNMTARIIDLVAPIGKGQRGIIVSPPKAGKTTVMKTIAKSIELNNPEVTLLVLLIDERPEEVTDMRRSVKGEVISSTFDRPSDEHTHVAEMTIAKARRMVEDGKDVVIILDGITRLSRAYNLAAPASGKILSGGIDAGALYPPKKFFGSARNVEEGGSLTILATALVDTNSRMDEAIFEEFKGTGNMELRLDRKVAERRIYPAIDVDASSTRHEELLFDRKQLQQVWKLRRVLSGLAQDGSAAAGLELLIDRLKTFRTNDEFLAEIAKQPSM
ncbi:MAG TPA: transcription termination factor Rho [Ilumatobacteraceae bacterium]|nr:transcription termination factor Rho [Ilumatobacteraceae bacterium]